MLRVAGHIQLDIFYSMGVSGMYYRPVFPMHATEVTSATAIGRAKIHFLNVFLT